MVLYIKEKLGKCLGNNWKFQDRGLEFGSQISRKERNPATLNVLEKEATKLGISVAQVMTVLKNQIKIYDNYLYWIWH